MTLTGLIDTCFQRGYAWDDERICVYSQLPSGGAGLGPSGNFIPVAGSPTLPIQAALNLEVKRKR